MNFVTLKTIADIKVGYQARSRIEDRIDGTYKLIQGKDFDSLKRLNTCALTNFIPDRNPELYSIKKGDIIFMARGSEHFAYHVDKSLTDTLVSSSFYVISLKSQKLLSSYLAWWLNQPVVQNAFKANSAGTIMSFVSKGDLSAIEITVPPMTIQKNIVRIMELRDKENLLRKRLIDYRIKLIDKLCLDALNVEQDYKELV